MPHSAILSGITIVVVEDYPDTLFGIAHFLTRHGAKVFPVQTLSRDCRQSENTVQILFCPISDCRNGMALNFCEIFVRSAQRTAAMCL